MSSSFTNLVFAAYNYNYALILSLSKQNYDLVTALTTSCEGGDG